MIRWCIKKGGIEIIEGKVKVRRGRDKHHFERD